MVDYAEEADFVGRKNRRRRNPEEIAERRAAKAAARSPAQWRSFARDVVYRQLSAMDRSEFQLRQALERQLVPAEIIDETLEKFIDADLVNDERFAQSFVRSRFQSKTTSKRALRQDLTKKGIDSEIAEAALEQVSVSQEFDSAMEFARKKAHSMRNLDKEVAQRRLFSALARRGFEQSIVFKCVSVALSETGVDSDDH